MMNIVPAAMPCRQYSVLENAVAHNPSLCRSYSSANGIESGVALLAAEKLLLDNGRHCLRPLQIAFF